MSRAYLNLGVSPRITPLAMLRVAIGSLHPDTLAVCSWRAARKRYYRELLQAQQRLRFGRKSPVSDWRSSTRIFQSARPSGRAFSFLEVLWPTISPTFPASST